MDTLKVLRSVEVLTGFDDDAIGRLAEAATTKEYSSGQLILRLGQVVEAVGVVVSGSIEAQISKKKITIVPGTLFGEISLLTGDPALADVVAISPSRVVHIPHQALSIEIGKNLSASYRLTKLLAEHLAKRDEDPKEQERINEMRSSRGHALRSDEPVLVLNLGSSSIKYALFVSGKRRASGLVDKVGSQGAALRHDGPDGRVERAIDAPDHEKGLQMVLEILTHPQHGAIQRLADIAVVGHRTVHGGTKFTEATVVDEAVIEELENCSSLAPLHNPINLLGINLCKKLLPEEVSHVGVFDTAFHMTMPEHAYRYALPTAFADERDLRRFGFHGTSHKYVYRQAGTFLKQPPNSIKAITCHLGNGASIAAVQHGRCIDTSMGLTPLEGLIMGTRAGDVDPGLILNLLDSGMSAKQVDNLLNKKSGLLGLSGISGDMRELEIAADGGNPGALLAISAFCYRVRKYIGAYCAALDGFDTLVFTGGIGENGDIIRSRICNGLGFLGVKIDEEKNRLREKNSRCISTDDSKIKVLVIPTDEEKMIAEDAIGAIARSEVLDVLVSRKDRPIPIGVSARHVHLTDDDVEKLFGKGHRLTKMGDLRQKAGWPCEERVKLIGPKGTIERVRVLGPTRQETQVEISRTEEFKLGIDAPVRASGDIKGSPGITLVGPEGELTIKEGVICAQRHIHMHPQDALAVGIRDKDVVRVQLEGERSLIFGDVLVRVHPDFIMEMHIDTDEANAAELDSNSTAVIESIQHRN